MNQITALGVKIFRTVFIRQTAFQYVRLDRAAKGVIAEHTVVRPGRMESVNGTCEGDYLFINRCIISVT